MITLALMMVLSIAVCGGKTDPALSDGGDNTFKSHEVITQSQRGLCVSEKEMIRLNKTILPLVLQKIKAE